MRRLIGPWLPDDCPPEAPEVRTDLLEATEESYDRLVEPENVRQPGIKYVNVDSQEYAKKRSEMAVVAKEIFDIK